MSRTFIGVIHLPPLPGSPRGGSLDAALARALHDIDALREGGADGVILENFGDAPFAPGPVEPITVAAMARIAAALRPRFQGMFGINVLRNDARAALAIAAATGADFIRVNIHVGAMVTDQGLIQGDARSTLLDRARFGSGVQIAADVLVKHATPLGHPSLPAIARDTAYRGLADMLIVTGSGTGQPHDPVALRAVRRAVPDRPVWVGSGVEPAVASQLDADGAIVGTYLHEDGCLSRPLDVERVRAIRRALDHA